ncbi:MAG: prepilin-type N-terminal cleavage/methylation domain-containing protein [Myxococcota bacterium]|jgi:prepilin-type N-terminal cleavage/methylation domain-containing protein
MTEPKPTVTEPKPTVTEASQRGFSLLEIMIATAILAVVFAYVAGTVVQGGYFQAKAPIYTQASLLVRGIVLDVEFEYQRDGFPSNDITAERCELPDGAGDGFECRYDLEKLDIESNDLSGMAQEMLEEMMGSSEDGNILAAIPALAFLLPNPALAGIPVLPPPCALMQNEISDVCQINIEKVIQNMTMMAGFIPIIIGVAAERTRKLRVNITHRSHGKDPVLTIETFIISVPEEQQAAQKDNLPEATGP